MIGVYKIITKVLANRLKIVLDNIVSKTHNAFIRGLQIVDFVLIANDCLDSCLNLVSRAYYVNWI
jgi:hypothetical protein